MTIKEFHAQRLRKINYTHSTTPIITVADFYEDFHADRAYAMLQALGIPADARLKTLSKGIYTVERPEINNAFMEKLAFQCSNVMGRTFNMAHPFLDADSAELRMNFIHDSIFSS